MAKYRVWAQSISDVYIDIEAESEEQARERAEDIDGGDFHDDGMGDWIFGSVAPLDDDADVDFNNEYWEGE